MSEDNVINLADRRPVQAPTPVEPVDVVPEYQTKVAPELWNSFSPETKSDALTNDVVANVMKVFENIGMETTDNEVLEVYGAVAKISDRFFGVEKGDSDGE